MRGASIIAAFGNELYYSNLIAFPSRNRWCKSPDDLAVVRETPLKRWVKTEI
jgi:hypothetical protein